MAEVLTAAEQSTPIFGENCPWYAFNCGDGGYGGGGYYQPGDGSLFDDFGSLTDLLGGLIGLGVDEIAGYLQGTVGLSAALSQEVANVLKTEGVAAATQLLEESGIDIGDSGDGSAPQGRKDWLLQVPAAAGALESGTWEATGPIRVQLEYSGAAAIRTDPSERARIFQDVMTDVPTARNGDDSGRIHNEMTLDARGMDALAAIVIREQDLQAGVISGMQQTGTGTGGSGDGSGDGNGDEQRAGFSMPQVVAMLGVMVTIVWIAFRGA